MSDSSKNLSEFRLVKVPTRGVPDPVDTATALKSVSEAVLAEPGPVAVDAERASGFRYGEPTVLVQLKVAGGQTFLLDTIAVEDLSSLQASVGQQEWILHDADQDLRGIAEHGLRPAKVFDTSVAARLIGLRRFGLAAVCEQLLGLTLDKDHQRANWATRPLPQDWLRYAALDVELLHQLREILLERLSELDRLSWFEESCEAIRLAGPRAPKPDRWRKGAHGVLRSPREFALLKELWEVRDDAAKELDVSPSKLVNTKALVAAAAQHPRNRRDLGKIHAFRSPLARQYEERWLAAVETVRWLPPEELPPVKPASSPSYIPIFGSKDELKDAASRGFDSLKAKLNRLATDLDIESVLIATSAQIKHLAWLRADYALSDEAPDYAAEMEELGLLPWQQAQLLKLL
ncbi:hypothetical protein BSR29_08420 [Boudabousia liubingyangii]|uniref:HRDC domain-containing protein n=1 Tax=Boudabousia liubingyangii TaxID=1921764 RepID=A0A1Q5PJE2_9ACTO|nr:HRDC domain-containing protein [Boudabousia liubingyangii]OKL45994.1 hypothetical protein BSR29_08420 [Boudabousia liubingyangii]